MTSKEFAKKLRKYLKADPRLKKISVRIGQGTTPSWVEIHGQKEYGGNFTDQEFAALKEHGFPWVGICRINLDWEDQRYLAEKFNL